MTGTDVRYYRVSPKFWSDPAVMRWDDDARLLALYLLTCPHRTTEGLFRMPTLYARADLGWDGHRFDVAFDRLQADGFCSYDPQAQVLLIHAALRYQSPDNGNQVAAAVKALRQLPPTPLTSVFKGLAERFAQRLAEGLPEGFGEPLAEGLPEPLAEPLAEGFPEGFGNPPPPPPPPSTSSEVNTMRTAVRDESKPSLRSTRQAERASGDDDGFDAFWAVYPPRQGRKQAKGEAHKLWQRLTGDERRRAQAGAEHLAASGQMPKDAHRFLRRSTVGEFPFDDWQEPAAMAARDVFGVNAAGAFASQKYREAAMIRRQQESSA